MSAEGNHGNQINEEGSIILSEGTEHSKSQNEIRYGIHEGVRFDKTFVLMNIMSAIIASYGLLSDSAAVVIGAMVIALLLNPITGIALAIAEDDYRFFGKSFVTLLGGVFLVYITAFVIGLIHKETLITREIMSRTTPNLMDLMIAFAGGVAGGYAPLSSRPTRLSFVGIAIATALVPPISASAILMARGETALAGGAFLLVCVNIIAIQFSSSAVMWLSGFGKIRWNKSVWDFLFNNLLSIGALIILGGILSANLHQMVANQVFESKTSKILTQEIDNYPGYQLADIRFDNSFKDRTIVYAVVRGPNILTSEQVSKLESWLPYSPFEKEVKLRIRFVQTTTITPEGILLNTTDDENPIKPQMMPVLP
jgi:uncharacterized hydrophobic protein (TIGR00271 family)